MSNKVIVTKSKLDAIGDSIRDKLNEENKYTLDEMPTAIESIEGGSSSRNQGYIQLSQIKIKVDTFINRIENITITSVTHAQ